MDLKTVLGIVYHKQSIRNLEKQIRYFYGSLTVQLKRAESVISIDPSCNTLDWGQF